MGQEKRQVRGDDPSSRYNVADMITIAVILKQAGPDGTSMFNYRSRPRAHISVAQLSGAAVRRIREQSNRKYSLTVRLRCSDMTANLKSCNCHFQG